MKSWFSGEQNVKMLREADKDLMAKLHAVTEKNDVRLARRFGEKACCVENRLMNWSRIKQGFLS
jgi:hypothetical protein